MDRPWHSHYDPGVPPHLDYPDMTLPEMFEQTVEHYADRAATIFHSRVTTYGETQRHIEAFAANLRSMGVNTGDQVALMLPNIPQFVVAFFGTLRAGAIVVPTNPLYTQHELEHQLADAGATAIVTLDQLFHKVQAALPWTAIRTVIVTGIGEALPVHLRPLFAMKQRRQGIHVVRRAGIVHRFEEMLVAASSPTVPLTSPDDVAVLQYTGGTTGLSKGAILTHRNLVANAVQARSWQGDLNEDHVRVLCVAPFFHVYGLTVCMNLSVVSGATMLLVPRWNAREVAAVANKHRPQIFPGVPTMYVALSQLDEKLRRKLQPLQICMSGAAPLALEVQQRFEAFSGARVVEGYGLTEASPITHCNPVMGDRRAGTVGVPFPDTDARITDPETWEPLPVGAVGELTVSGPQVMKGYWNRPEETLSVLRGGWLHTGDIATMDADGYFRIVDRKKDIIIVSGFNVYPREVEDVLRHHPEIKEAAIVGVASDYQGEMVKAVIVLEAGAATTPEQIVAFCKEELAPYKVPRIVEFTDALPKTLIGKVLRRKLRDGPAGTGSQASTGRASGTTVA